MVERENGAEAKDLEKGEVGLEEKVIEMNNNSSKDDDSENHKNDGEEFQLSRFQRLNPTNPLRIVVNGRTNRVSNPPPPSSSPSPFQSQHSQPRFTPITPQQVISL